MKRYKQLTSEERYIISHLRKQGLNLSQIAVNWDVTTVLFRVNYLAIHADRVMEPIDPVRLSDTRARRSRSRRNLHYTENDFIVVRQLLRKKLNPEQITGYLRK